MKLVFAGLAALFLVLIAPALASAHAFLDHAEPAVGSRVSLPPTEVKIWFSAELDPKVSTIKVLDGQGNQVDKKDSRVDDNDKTLLTVSVSKLPAGKYKVLWRVVSIGDGHKTHGDFTFEVVGGMMPNRGKPRR